MPELNTATDESVAQVVDAHFAMAASCTPTEVASKLPENPLDRPLEDEAARGGPEQWRVSSGRAMTRPNRQVTLQRRHNGGVQWHVPGLAELRVPNRQDSLVEIQIAAVQMERFRQAQTGGGDQPEDRRVSGRPQSALRAQGARRPQEGRKSPAQNRCAARGGGVSGRRLRSAETRWPGRAAPDTSRTAEGRPGVEPRTSGCLAWPRPAPSSKRSRW